MKTIAALIAIAGIASVCAVANGQTVPFGGTPLFIGDNTVSTIDTAPLVGAGAIVTVTCTLDWNPLHTWAGDLIAQLTFTPTGGSPVTVDLTNRRGGSSDWFGQYTFADSGENVFAAGNVVGPPGVYQATTTGGAAVSLNTAFAGMPVAGVWSLMVSDNAGGDTGTIDSASITVVGGTAPIPPSGAGNTFTIARNSALPGPFSGLLQVRTTGGFNPPSTVAGVRANLTSVLGAGHATDVLYDDGTNGDVAAGDGTYSRTVTPLAALADGVYSIPFVVSDNRVPPRTGTGNATANVITILGPAGATNLGTLGANSTASGTANAFAGEAAWFTFTSATAATDPNSYLDMYVLSNTGYTDTYMAVFDAAGNFLHSDDDDGFGLLSQMSFGRTTPERVYNGGGNAIGSDGPLTAGTYYVAVVQYFSSFSSPFGFSNTSTGATTAEIGVTTSNSAPASINPTMTARFAPAFYTNTTGGPAGPVTFTSSLLSATVVSGRFPSAITNTVTADLTDGLGGGTSVILFDDGTNGDVTAGDNIFSRTVSLAAVTVGPHTATISLVDDQGRIASASPVLTRNADVVITTTNLGTLAFTGTPAVITGSTELAGREVNWLRFTLDAAVDIGGTRFLDIDTNGSTMDTHIGLFDSVGTYLSISDDDGGDGLDSALTFGSIDPTGRDTNPAGSPNNGNDGGLAAGTYYLALNFFPATYNTPFIATSTNGGVGGTYVYNVYSGDQNGSTGPVCIADINGDQIIDGADFILFINSFGVGDVSIDANADVAGGIPSGGDGIIDGTDFIAFINAFGAGC